MRATTKAFIKRLKEKGFKSVSNGIGEDGSDILSIYNGVSNYPVIVGINDSCAHMLLCITRLKEFNKEKLLKDINEMNRNSSFVSYVLNESDVMAQSSVPYTSFTMVDNCMLIFSAVLNGAETYRCILETIHKKC